MRLVKLKIPQPKARNKTLMNREIQTPSEKSFLRLIQCNPPIDAAEDRSIATASTGIYRLMLSLHLAHSPPTTVTLNLRTSGVITTARCAQAAMSRSGVPFAQTKCHYALMLTTFGLRLNLMQLLSILLCLYTYTQFNNFIWFFFLVVTATCTFHTHVFVCLCFHMLIPC